MIHQIDYIESWSVIYVVVENLEYLALGAEDEGQVVSAR